MHPSRARASHWRSAAVALLAQLAAPASSAPTCRCSPGAACWSSIPWPSLNASVSGRLSLPVDPVAACAAAAPACNLSARTDDEFWLTGAPLGYTRSGQYGAWKQ